MAYLVPERLLFLAFGLLLVGAVASSVYRKDWRKTGYTAVTFMAAASVALWVLAAHVLACGAADTRAFLAFDPLGASLTFHIDRLSAVFLLVVPFVGLAAMLYAVEYMKKLYPGQSPARYYPFALLLMATIVGVVTTSDLFFFFIFWEMMTLTSWVLVWFERDDETKVRAAWQYFIFTHVASACILAAGIVAYTRSGSFAFGDIARVIGQMAQSSPALVHLLMALFLIGFATKAGMFPLGAWLPQAYPAAPSPASAAFAGSMTKLGIYGIVRVFFEFFQAPQLTTVWGAIIAVLGTTSIFVGTLTALREDDAKRVLSFHIIGQIGYMLLGIGTGLFFLRSSPALATVALMAGLYHVINHACYKSLLFLNVGAAEYYTRTRDLNKMGGLGSVMRVTTAAAIIASLSIAGIPPLSGFASKWLIYQSAFQGGIRFPLFLLLGFVAMFISLVTLASFMKLLGSIFLGKQAAGVEKVTSDVPVSMRIPQIGLSAVCVLLGVVPILPLLLLYGVAREILGASFVPGFAGLFGSDMSGIALNLGKGVTGLWNPAYAVAALAVCVAVAYAISRAGLAPSRRTKGWYCGEEYQPEEVRARAHGFCLPFKNAFAKVYPSVRVPRINALRLLQRAFDVDSWLYNPLVNAGARMTELLSRTHSGIPQVYMVWQLVGMILAFAILFLLLRGHV